MPNTTALELCKSYLSGHGVAIKAAKPDVIVRVERDIGWVLPILTVGAGQSTEEYIRSTFSNEEQTEAMLALDMIVNMHGRIYQQSLSAHPEAMNGFKQLAEYLDTDLKRRVYGHFTMSFMLGCHAILIVPPLNRLGLTPDLARIMLEPLTAVPLLSMLSQDTRKKVIDELASYGQFSGMPNVLRMKLECEDYCKLIKDEQEKLTKEA